MKTILALIFLGLLLISLQACKNYQSHPMSDITFLETRFGKDVIDVLNHPEVVSFFYVNPQGFSPNNISTSNEILLSDKLIAELQNLVLNDDHYVRGLNKLTMFLPTIAFKFYKKNAEDVLILLSPVGDQLMLLHENTDFILDYDPAKIGFDNYIQKLK